jgi:hypothetical protein
MLDDMTFRNMSPSTIKVYSAAVANFSALQGRSPDKLSIEDARAYHLHLIERGLKASSINPIVGALRFFYGTTQVAQRIPFARKDDTLPAVLSESKSCSSYGPISRCAPPSRPFTPPACVSEVVALTVRDIDSARMVIRIQQAKGHKDRFVIPSEQLPGSCAATGGARGHHTGSLLVLTLPSRSRRDRRIERRGQRQMRPASTMR